MSKQDTGGPAHPRQATGECELCEGLANHSGMTLLDYFAGQVMAGMAANPDFCAGVKEWSSNAEEGNRLAAEQAYDVADAMLAEKARREAESD